jgi:hypothetical protein
MIHATLENAVLIKTALSSMLILLLALNTPSLENVSVVMAMFVMHLEHASLMMLVLHPWFVTI